MAPILIGVTPIFVPDVPRPPTLREGRSLMFSTCYIATPLIMNALKCRTLATNIFNTVTLNSYADLSINKPGSHN